MARKIKIITESISSLVAEVAQDDRASAMAVFLQEKTGSIFGRWEGRLNAASQRTLFGRYIGKGNLHICGAQEAVAMTVKVCFGTDWDVTFRATWAELVYS